MRSTAGCDSASSTKALPDLLSIPPSFFTGTLTFEQDEDGILLLVHFRPFFRCGIIESEQMQHAVDDKAEEFLGQIHTVLLGLSRRGVDADVDFSIHHPFIQREGDDIRGVIVLQEPGVDRSYAPVIDEHYGHRRRRAPVATARLPYG